MHRRLGPRRGGGRRRQVYWADYAGATIRRADLDGTGVNPSFITGAGNPTGSRSTRCVRRRLAAAAGPRRSSEPPARTASSVHAAPTSRRRAGEGSHPGRRRQRPDLRGLGQRPRRGRRRQRPRPRRPRQRRSARRAGQRPPHQGRRHDRLFGGSGRDLLHGPGQRPPRRESPKGGTPATRRRPVLPFFGLAADFQSQS